ncbi:MAG: hypothetical protein AAF514_21315 [Verrucomicrobiota bacterium]
MQRAVTIAIAVLLIGLVHRIEAKPVRAQMILKNKGAEPIYAIEVEGRSLVAATNPSGTGKRKYPLTLIESIKFDTKPDDWKRADTAWFEGKYGVAAGAYEKLATEYRGLLPLKDKFPAISLYRYLECLRKQGDYDTLRKKWTLLKKSFLSEQYHGQIDLYPAWAAVDKVLKNTEKPKRLGLLLDELKGKKLGPAYQAQAGFLAGVYAEKSGDPQTALSEYHKAFTLNFGTDESLARTAMAAALKLYAEDEDLEKDRIKAREAYGVGRVYKKNFGTTGLGKGVAFTKPMPKELGAEFDDVE